MPGSRISSTTRSNPERARSRRSTATHRSLRTRCATAGSTPTRSAKGTGSSTCSPDSAAESLLTGGRDVLAVEEKAEVDVALSGLLVRAEAARLGTAHVLAHGLAAGEVVEHGLAPPRQVALVLAQAGSHRLAGARLAAEAECVLFAVELRIL